MMRIPAPQIPALLRLRQWIIGAIGISFLAFPSPLPGAESLALIKDINEFSEDSAFGDFLAVSETLYFTVDDGIHGMELWKSNGTDGGTVLVRDLEPGPEGSDPGFFGVMNGELYFFAWSAANGTGLWKTNGTEAGTVFLQALNSGNLQRPYSRYAAVIGTNLYFAGTDTTSNQTELWTTDGTPGGTTLVKDLPAEIFGGSPDFLKNVGGTLFFLANSTSFGLHELWRSDGTEAGTVPVSSKTFRMLSGSSDGAAVANSLLFFIAQDSTSQWKLWTSNGTDAGTTYVTLNGNSVYAGGVSNQLEVLNDEVFFVGPNAGVYRTDGTPGGTHVVKVFNSTRYPLALTTVGNGMYFFAGDNFTYWQLWRTDGSEAGTVLVDAIHAAPSTPQPESRYHTSELNGLFYASASDSPFGGDYELWQSNGSAAGTVQIVDLYPGIDEYSRPNSSYPSYLTNVQGTLFFTAETPEYGIELWKTDGTAGGTTLVRNIRPGTKDSRPAELTEAGGVLFFSADDGLHGRTLWTSDGTAGGTNWLPIAGANLDGSAPAFEPNGLTRMGDLLYFAATDPLHGEELWRSDGTAGGTWMVADICTTGTALHFSSPHEITAVGETLFFVAYTAEYGNELWRSDGTEAGTSLVRDIRATDWPAAAIGNLTAVGDSLFFTADDGTHGNELWTSDGSEAGTKLVRDIVPSGTSAPNFLTDWNGTLFFVVQGRLWKSNGTEAGTVQVQTGNPVEWAGNVRELAVAGDALFFQGTLSPYGVELWKTDGTDGGTTVVLDIYPGQSGVLANSSLPEQLTAVGATLFFVAWDDVHGWALWKSNGTAAGTMVVKDPEPGPGQDIFDPKPEGLANVGGTLYFSAFDSARGRELWRSDGTAGGTAVVQEIVPGIGWADPENITPFGGAFFFTAFDLAHGVELWAGNRDALPPEAPALEAEPPWTAGTSNEIRWLPAARAETYEMEYADNPAFAPVLGSATVSSPVVSRSIGGLADGVAYWYRVRASGPTGTGRWSAPTSSTQDATPPDTHVEPLPPSVQSQAIDIHWSGEDSGSGLDSVQLFYWKTPGGAVPYGNRSTTSPILFDSRDAGGNGEYGFFTVGYDTAGNREPAPWPLDARTVVEATSRASRWEGYR